MENQLLCRLKEQRIELYLNMTVMKEAGAEWLESMLKYISNNPQFIVNGFVRGSINSGKDPDNEPLSETDGSTSENSDTDEGHTIIDYIVL